MTIPLFSILSILFCITLFIIWRKISSLSKDVNEFQQDLINVRAHISASIKQLQSPGIPSNNNIKISAPQNIFFTLDMSIGEVMALHPDAQNILAMHHLGGCSSCNISDEHKLGEAIKEYGIDEKSLLTNLNSLFDSRMTE